jgi:coenzyme F420-reducing hydrogenase delta subunit/ferredoxin
MWVHVQRRALPETLPPRALAWGTFGALVLLALAAPVASDGPANLAVAPETLALDWFYLAVHAFADVTSPLALWLAVGGFTLLLVLLPVASRVARAPRPVPAVVNLANCNGCARCFADCPYAAVTMQPRTDGRKHRRQAVVDPDLCAGCGICAGACPSSTPFRSVAELATGIDMPQAPIDALRAELEAALARLAQPAPLATTRHGISPAITGARDDDAGATASAIPHIVAFGCRPEQGGADLATIADDCTATVFLLCAAQLPPSFVEYALRAGADGVLVTGCRDGECMYRLGNRWVDERLAGARAPRLRAAVPRDRLRIAWAGRGDEAQLRAALLAFRADLAVGKAAHRAAFASPPKRSASFRERVPSE